MIKSTSPDWLNASGVPVLRPSVYPDLQSGLFVLIHHPVDRIPGGRCWPEYSQFGYLSLIFPSPSIRGVSAADWIPYTAGANDITFNLLFRLRVRLIMHQLWHGIRLRRINTNSPTCNVGLRRVPFSNNTRWCWMTRLFMRKRPRLLNASGVPFWPRHVPPIGIGGYSCGSTLRGIGCPDDSKWTTIQPPIKKNVGHFNE